MVDRALTNQQISGLLLLCFENERPLQGMIAHLDWRLDGHFSKLMKTQRITGARGEVVYAPLLWNQRTLHFLVFGGGFRSEAQSRPAASQSLLPEALLKLDELKLPDMALSRMDWDVEAQQTEVRERKLCIVN
jgi:hypothetical protein